MDPEHDEYKKIEEKVTESFLPQERDEVYIFISHVSRVLYLSQDYQQELYTFILMKWQYLL